MEAPSEGELWSSSVVVATLDDLSGSHGAAATWPWPTIAILTALEDYSGVGAVRRAQSDWRAVDRQSLPSDDLELLRTHGVDARAVQEVVGEVSRIHRKVLAELPGSPGFLWRRNARSVALFVLTVYFLSPKAQWAVAGKEESKEPWADAVNDVETGAAQGFEAGAARYFETLRASKIPFEKAVGVGVVMIVWLLVLLVLLCLYMCGICSKLARTVLLTSACAPAITLFAFSFLYNVFIGRSFDEFMMSMPTKTVAEWRDQIAWFVGACILNVGLNGPSVKDMSAQAAVVTRFRNMALQLESTYLQSLEAEDVACRWVIDDVQGTLRRGVPVLRVVFTDRQRPLAAPAASARAAVPAGRAKARRASTVAAS